MAFHRAITPRLHFRNVLETTENLNFSRIMKFLQLHFEERNTKDLCQHLSSITQVSQETATQFIYRAISLRQKLIVLLKSPAVEIKYDQDVVQRLVLKSFETGLISKTIITEIKSIGLSKMIRKFAVTLLNVLGRVILPESVLQVREKIGD